MSPPDGPGDRLEVSRPSGGALHANQRLEPEAPAAHAEQVERFRVRQEIVVAAAARDFAQEIQFAEVGGEREIQTGVQRGNIQSERQSRRRTPQDGRRGASVFSSRSRLACDRAYTISTSRVVRIAP